MGKTQLNKTFSEEEVNALMSFLKSLTGDIQEDAKKVPLELSDRTTK